MFTVQSIPGGIRGIISRMQTSESASKQKATFSAKLADGVTYKVIVERNVVVDQPIDLVEDLGEDEPCKTSLRVKLGDATATNSATETGGGVRYQLTGTRTATQIEAAPENRIKGALASNGK